MLNNKVLSYFGLFFMVLIVSCGTNERSNIKVFDLNEYWIKNSEVLQQEIQLVKKRLVSDSSQVDLIDTISDWKKELELFSSVKWNDKQALQYDIDSTLNGQNRRIRYTAKDSSLEVQSLLIEKIESLGDETARVRIHRKIEKSIYSINQELYFDPLTGYFIKGQQKIPYIYDEYYQVFAQWD